MSDYTIRLEKVFQGPLDLLLHLVRQQEVEIQEIEISRVIEGYLSYLDALRDLDIELAGDFLVMAATLMSIKSRSLLPREEVNLEEELDPRDELIQRLLEYRRFKESADGLAERQLERERLHGRGDFSELKEEPEQEVQLELGELTAWDLLGVFSRLMRETRANQPHRVAGDPRPMRFFVREMAHRIRELRSGNLRDLLAAFEGPDSRETLVGAFCALLELIKLGVVTASQGEGIDEIRIDLRPEAAEGVDDLLDATHFEDEMLPQDDEEAVTAAPEGSTEPAPGPAKETSPEVMD